MKRTEIIIPGSKSYTNRALFVAALTKGTVKIYNPLISDDTKAMIACLKSIGIAVIQKENSLEITNDISQIEDKEYRLNADLSGTTIRFMLALLAIVPGKKILRGEAGLNKRPIADLVNALRQLGADIIYLEKEGFPPLQINSQKLTTDSVTINGSVSSQFLSALLMIAPVVGGLTINVAGELISKPYIAMTVDLMKQFGVLVSIKDQTYSVASEEKYVSCDYTVEGDVSSASYFFAIAALTKQTITLKNLNPHSKQADMGFIKILKDMGNEIILGENEITIVGKGIKAVTVDMEDCPDQAQTLAVLAAFVDGATKITGIKSLRVKETERIKAVESELAKMGIKTESTEDTLTIFGGDPRAAEINTHGDHRMAMAFAVAKTKLPEIKINNPEVVTKTFPKFWKELSRVGNLEKTNIILIGMRGSGKTTVGKLLAQKLDKQFVDLDKELENKLQMKVAAIVAKNGWNFFREAEAKIAQEAQFENCVIATGGGVILRAENVAALKKDGLVVFLNANVQTLTLHIGDSSSRPSLTKEKSAKDEIIDILKVREPLYKQYADVIISTDNKNKSTVVEEIYQKLQGPKILCLVIGDPVDHSLSPKMHNAGYAALGLTEKYNYIAKRVIPEELKNFVEEIRTNSIRGVSCTIPHKQAVIPYLDEIDEVAQKIGAVNTIVNTNGFLKGYNTDYLGIRLPLEKITSLTNKNILVLGAGGAARAVCFALAEKKANIFIYNRTRAKAETLAKDFSATILENIDNLADIDIIINTTSVGLAPGENETPLPKEKILKKHIVFDLVYSANKKTRLLQEAEEQGATIIAGKEMLLFQGLEQFRLFTGYDAPINAMRKALL